MATEEERNQMDPEAYLVTSPDRTPSTPSPNPNATGGNRSVNMYTARGATDQFGGGLYDVSQLSYPDDLFQGDSGYSRSQYGGNYVIFYINVSEDSKLFSNGSTDINGNAVETIDPSLVPPRDRGQLIALDLSKTELVSTVGAQGTAGAAAAVVGGASLGQAAAGVAINTAGSAIAANFSQREGAKATRQQKRLKTAVAMHIPNQLQIRYSSQWTEEDTAAFAMTQGVGGEIINAMRSMTGDTNSNFMETGGAAASAVYLNKGVGGGAVSAATGLAANPKKEQLFKGVDFRTFSFEYQFFPRSSNEARNVERIIRTFKYHMHPEMKDSRNFLYLYPSEFDIFYYQDGVENKHLHRHTSCVLTDLNVNYTPNGVFSTFEDGMPTQINVSMTFKELAVLTKEKIMDGM